MPFTKNDPMKNLIRRTGKSLILGVGLIIILIGLISHFGSAQAATELDCVANPVNCSQHLEDSEGVVSAQAQPKLHIFKTGPTTFEEGDPITYTLTVTNSGPAIATNLVITDTLPTNANYVSGGTRVGNVISWTIPSLAANGGVTQTSFIVTSTQTQTITNSDYAVRADGGVGAVGENTVVSNVILGSGGTPAPSSNPQILPAGSDTVAQNAVFGVRLINHRDEPRLYDIYLSPISDPSTTYKICPPTDDGLVAIETDPNGNGVFDCRISTVIPPAEYRLFSTKEGLTTPIAYFEPVTVLAGDAPSIQIEGGNTLAANSHVEITLSNHAIADEKFRLYFDDGLSETEITPNPVAAEPAPTLLWAVPLSAATACPPNSSPCRIFSRSENSSAPDPYAEVELWIVRPEILLAQGQTEYRPGETIRIALAGHTPNTEYDIRFTLVPTGTNPYPAQRVKTNSGGEFATLEVLIPDDGSWPDGNYVITSHQIDNPDLDDFIAEKAIQISTPPSTYITVEDGYSHPAGSTINIRMHFHAQTKHYLTFGPWLVETPADDNTFVGVPDGRVTISYRIPLTTAAGSPQEYIIRSWDAGTDTVVALATVTVLPAPIIEVLEGLPVTKDATVTIRLINHEPHSTYDIYYGRLVGDLNGLGKKLVTTVTDANGQAMVSYDLKDLPAEPPPNFSDPHCNCYGVSYELYSQTISGDQVAGTELAINPALTITKTAPATVNAGDPITYTLTVANSGTTTATNLLITDTLPAGANYLSGGSRTGEVISWSVASLPVSATTQVSFVVTASQTVVNSDYGARADDGLIAVGGDPVETGVQPDESGLFRRVFLPLVLKR